MQSLKELFSDGKCDIHDLNELEEEILRMSFGYGDDHQMSDEDIADILMVRPEYVQKTRAHALRKLEKKGVFHR